MFLRGEIRFVRMDYVIFLNVIPMKKVNLILI